MSPLFFPKQEQPDFSAIAQPDPNRIVATWVGHSTFLLQFGGRNFLTDPHFSTHCAPVPLPAFRRRTSPGLSVGQLPKIDAILLGHNHYDHLDLPSLRALAPGTEVFCPLGVGPLLKGIGARVTEMAWGEDADFDGIGMTCLPTQHGSARTPFDRNHSLWCGWMLEHRGKRVVFLSDTAYAPMFSEMGQLFGAVDFAMIPIGAYRPSWFMRPLHLDPAEAVQVHLDLRAKNSVAMHWGTFLLADDPLGEPAMLLHQARERAGIDPGAFRALGIGETLMI